MASDLNGLYSFDEDDLTNQLASLISDDPYDPLNPIFEEILEKFLRYKNYVSNMRVSNGGSDAST